MCWLCENPGATPEDYENRIRQLITRFGWAIQAVERDGPHPPWAYTAGLTGRGLPELVVTGTDPVPAAALLNAAAEDLLHGKVPEPGAEIRLRGGQLAEVVTVAVPDAHLNVAVALYGDAVTALQLVHASPDGRWPWDDGYGGCQPVLGTRAARP
jgi:Domain of unknown function (DUF4262)